MATPTVTLLNHTPLTTADSSTGWFDTVTLDTDVKVEGSGSMSGVLRADAEVSYYDSTTAPVTAAGKTVRGWFNTTNVPYLEIFANNGLELYVYDGTTIETKAIAGIDTYSGGWLNYIYGMDAFTTLTLANVRRWGVRQQLTASAKNVVNAWHDVIRYLDGFSMVGGTSGDKVRLSDIATYDKAAAYGVLTEVNGVYFCTGTLQFGTGATAHYFEMDGNILIFRVTSVAPGLYLISGVGSGTDIVIKNSVIQAASSSAATRFILDFDDANLASLVFTDNLIVRSSTVAFKSGQTVTGNTFDNCGQITHGGADMDRTVIKNFAGINSAVGTAALLYNVNVDPDGELDDLEATKGSLATHVIELGPNTPSSITLRDWTVSGYNTSNGQNDSVIYNNSNKAITVNVPGASGTISYRNGTGASTSIAQSVTVTITAVTTSGTPVQGARVFLETTPGGTDVFDGSDSTSLTDVNGEVTAAYAGATPVDVIGRVRKSSGSPYYRTGEIVGSISGTGLDQTVVMIVDE